MSCPLLTEYVCLLAIDGSSCAGSTCLLMSVAREVMACSPASLASRARRHLSAPMLADLSLPIVVRSTHMIDSAASESIPQGRATFSCEATGAAILRVAQRHSAVRAHIG